VALLSPCRPATLAVSCQLSAVGCRPATLVVGCRLSIVAVAYRSQHMV